MHDERLIKDEEKDSEDLKLKVMER